MASLFKRGETWFVKYQIRGKVVRRSLRTKDKKQAQRDFEEIVARIRYGRLGMSGGKSDPLMRDLFSEHLLYCKAHLSARTYRDRNLHIRDKLGPFFGSFCASAVTTKMVEEFIGRLLSWTVTASDGTIRKKPYHPRSINLHLETLRRVLRRAVENGELAEMPCRIKLLREPKGLPRYVPMDHLRNWLAYLDEHHRLRAMLSLCTGITDRDLGYILLSGCDAQNRFIRFRRPKTTVDIVVPLNSTAAAILDILLRDNAGPHLFPAESVKKAYYQASKAYQAAGGINITPHMLRHTFATELLTQGVPIAHLRDLLGHADIETTQRYAKVLPEYLRSAVNTIEGPAVDLTAILSEPRKKAPHSDDEPKTVPQEKSRSI